MTEPPTEPALPFAAPVSNLPTQPARAYPAQLYPPQPHPDTMWPPVSGQLPTPPARSRRPGLIVTVVLGVVLVLCGGGGVGAYLLVEKAKPRGAGEPAAAVEGFLTAVFTNHSAEEAASFVCPTARDAKELAQVVFAVKAFEKNYSSPRTTWQYPDIQPANRQATAAVTLTLTTANEQVAEKQIRLLLVDDRGWWVCDVDSAG